MIACPQIECEAYNYSEENNCLNYNNVKQCQEYRKRRDQDILRKRKGKNMTATEVLQRNARDWTERSINPPIIKTEEETNDYCSKTGCDAYNYDQRNNCDRWFNVSKCASYWPTMNDKTEIKKMDEFDSALKKAKSGILTSGRVGEVKENVITTAKRTKNTVVRVKVGRLAITAIKSALKKTPGIPVYAKMLLDSEYADIVIGAVVPIIVPMITDSAKVLRVCEDITIAGGVAVADKLTFIDDFVAQVMAQVSSAVSADDLVEKACKDL